MFDINNDLHNVSKNFLDDVINGMFDWVRVIDKESNVVYMNKAMSSGLGGCHPGQKCYISTGKSSPCDNCITRRAIFDGRIHRKEEVINGKIYSVMSSPVRNQHGDIVAAVEVLRDVTNEKLLQQKVHQQNMRFKSDLEAAKKLQLSLLPKNFSDSRVNFSYIYRPCEALGGDFLDIFRIGENHIGVYIADVSGHGLSSSMLTVFLRSTLNRKLLSPSEALTQLYDSFNNTGIFQDLYITVFYAILDLRDSTLTYSNAGHNVIPVIFNKNAFDIISSAGIPISNWLPEPGYADTVKNLKSGDNIFFYTDGVVEVRNEENVQFGEDRLAKALTDSLGVPEEILQSVINQIDEFVGKEDGLNFCDDLTMAILQLK